MATIMEWFAGNGTTAAVLLVLLAVVWAIIRSMIRNKALGCDGCSGECAGCGGCCPTVDIELTIEQKADLEALRQRNKVR